ncbi:MAG: hypothetical protein Q7S12_01250 [bacterium]|nr:hypothetical protein [bacterium]
MQEKESNFIPKELKFTPTVEEIKQIRAETGTDLFNALIKYASKLPDFRQYDGPRKDAVIDNLEYLKAKEAAETAKSEMTKKLLAEGKSRTDIIRILKKKQDEN